MKKIIITVVCICVGLTCLAGDDIEVLQKRIDLLEHHESFLVTVFGIIIGAIGIGFGVLQWIFAKVAEEKVYRGLAKLAGQSKSAFKKTLKVKAVEMELTSKYPIYIITNQYRKNENASKILKLLRCYEFEQVNRISYKQASEMKFCDRSVVVLCDDPVDETRDKALVKHLLKNTPNLGVFGYAIHYNSDFKSVFNDKGCLNFAQFPSQVYNNLMSLLHYKRYLNKVE